MSKENQDSFLWGTTHQEVVRPAGDLRQLIEKLYDFGLNQSLLLPRAAKEQHLQDAVGEFIARLMEATAEASDLAPDRSELECARDILRQLRRPDDKARIHRKSGLRRRLKEQVLRELGAAPLLLHDPDTRSAQDDSAVEILRADDVPTPLLTEIRNELQRAWELVFRRAIVKFLKHSGPQARRKAILEILANKAQQNAPSGVIADHFETVLKDAKPAEIIAAIRARGLAPQRGRRKVLDQQLRHDIRIVKTALRDEIAPLKSAERSLRARLASQWAGRQLKSLLDEAGKAGEETQA